MSSISQVFEKWYSEIKRLRPAERKTRKRNFAWLLTGILLSKSIHLSKIAGKIPGEATATSRERRLSRFLDNVAIRVRQWYESPAKEILAGIAKNSHEIRLIVDGTKIGFGHQLLMVSVAYRQRAIPIAWTWINCKRGHSSGYKKLALLSYVRRLIPVGIPVLLVGDSEFGCVDVLKALDRWKWKYVLRQKASHLVKISGYKNWQSFGDLITKPGQCLWFGKGLLTQTHAYAVNLLAYWQVGEKEPWLLATNLPDQQAALAAYRRRMWIEEMFGDLKKHGFNLESTHLRHFMRLSRLTLAAVLLYIWLVAFGSQVIKAGLRRLVDRAYRRDLSIFHIGCKMIERCLTNSLSFSITFIFWT